MDLKIIIFALITFFHDFFTVLWMGGLIVTVISFLPAIKSALGPGPQVKKLTKSGRACGFIPVWLD